MSLLFIDWHPDEVLLSIPVNLSVPPWSIGTLLNVLYWIAGILLAYRIVKLIIYRRRTDKFKALITCCFICLLAGAHLGHCIPVDRPVGPLIISTLEIRWYALCWIVGILLGYLIVRGIYWREGIDPAVDADGRLRCTDKFEVLIIYCFVGVLVGARLGHCLFYDPQSYLTSWQGVVEMLLPVRCTASGGWEFSGYAGLASHGGVIGLIVALCLYARAKQLPFLQVLDMIGVAAAAPSCCIRIGNLINSEIIGKPTSLPWGFVFHLPEDLFTYGHYIPRHPAQLYEALAYLIILFFGLWLYLRTPAREGRLGTGFHFGFCLCSIFTFRFLVEFCKEVQGGADDGSTWLNMGQLLSIPIFLVGCWSMCGLPGLDKLRAPFRPSAAELKRSEKARRRAARDESARAERPSVPNRFNQQRRQRKTRDANGRQP